MYLKQASLAASQLPLARDGQGCPILNAQSFAGRKTNRAFISQVRCGAGDSADLAVFVEMEIIRAAGGAILSLLLSPGKRRCGYAVA